MCEGNIWLFCFCMWDGSSVVQKQMCQISGRGLLRSCPEVVYLVNANRISYDLFITV
jgi:hypothetical protein